MHSYYCLHLLFFLNRPFLSLGLWRFLGLRLCAFTFDAVTIPHIQPMIAPLPMRRYSCLGKLELKLMLHIVFKSVFDNSVTV